MDLVDRYLQAVSFWLPKRERNDIITELSEDIHSEIDERARVLGHPLAEEEVATLLKKHGSPVSVATRYLPQQVLIGPALFPVYKFVLKVVALNFLVPTAAITIALIASNLSPEAGTRAWASVLERTSSTMWGTAFFAFSLVTLIFAILERVQMKSPLLEQWNPHRLPAVRNPNQIPRLQSSIELAANVAGIMWLAVNLSPEVMNRPGLRVVLAPMWTTLAWGFLAVMLGNIAMAAISLLRPYWTVQRAALRLLLDAASSLFFCLLLDSHIVSSIGLANVTPERGVELTTTINMWLARAFPYTVAVGAVIAVFNCYRVIRLGTTRQASMRHAAAMWLLALAAGDVVLRLAS